jgi:hypothetical protein
MPMLTKLSIISSTVLVPIDRSLDREEGLQIRRSSIVLTKALDRQFVARTDRLRISRDDADSLGLTWKESTSPSSRAVQSNPRLSNSKKALMLARSSRAR